MSEFYLVRHGQASFGADNYDQLSELGYQQALWLGQHLKERDIKFDRVVLGSMARHQQTAENICKGLEVDIPFDVHEGLNEYDFHRLVKTYLQQFPEQAPSEDADHRDFYRVLKKALQLWSKDELNGDIPETWSNFQQRVRSALNEVQNCERSKRTLVVSSGGPIAMSMCQVLNLADEMMIQLNLQVKNTSFSQFFYNAKSIQLASFNCTSHLETAWRKDAITFS